MSLPYQVTRRNPSIVLQVFNTRSGVKLRSFGGRRAEKVTCLLAYSMPDCSHPRLAWGTVNGLIRVRRTPTHVILCSLLLLIIIIIIIILILINAATPASPGARSTDSSG
jgi:hypothetical protein